MMSQGVAFLPESQDHAGAIPSHSLQFDKARLEEVYPTYRISLFEDDLPSREDHLLPVPVDFRFGGNALAVLKKTVCIRAVMAVISGRRHSGVLAWRVSNAFAMGSS